jgi:hypothetical protein
MKWCEVGSRHLIYGMADCHLVLTLEIVLGTPTHESFPCGQSGGVCRESTKDENEVSVNLNLAPVRRGPPKYRPCSLFTSSS